MRGNSLVFCLALLVQIASGDNLSSLRLSQRITDQTATLSVSDIGRLERIASDFERGSSTQLVVLIIPSLEGGSIEEVAHEIASANKIGQKGKDNGILLLIAKNDRQVRFEVGYGLEGALPDILAGRIIRNEIAPRFAQGDFAGGIEAGMNAVILATKNEYRSDGSETDRSSKGTPFGFIFIIFLFFFLRNIFRRRRRFGGGVTPWIGGWGGRSGGGFGGGGFGGFSGGGGSFGGGGASGRW